MKSNEISAQPIKKLTSKVVAVGGAGIQILRHLAAAGLGDAEMLGVNCDAQTLSSLGAIPACLIGRQITRGMGAGGDPERGRAAAEADQAVLKEFCSGSDIVYIVAGLGGGAGTGASPVIARLAKEQGALVLAIVALPFEFEGSRRNRQAEMGLLELKAAADSVICLPNQSLLKLIDDKTTMVDTFHIANQFLVDGIQGIWRLTTQQGLLNIDFSDLCAITRGRHSVSSFATAEASGDQRAQQALEKLLAHPLLENGSLLTEADHLLVSLNAGPGLGIAEVNRLMEQIKRHCENAIISMGASIDPSLGSRLSVTLIASKREKCGAQQPETAEPEAWASPSMPSNVQEENPEYKTARPAPRFVPPAPDLSDEKKSEVFARQTGSARRKRLTSPRQGQLPLEIVSKGRFEKSEPTIYAGEDLDVPTYIRRGIALN